MNQALNKENSWAGNSKY